MNLEDKNMDNQLDAFSKSVQAKLHNHELKLDADLWLNIEKKIVTKKRRIIPIWLWIPLGSVGLIALIINIKSTLINEKMALRNPSIQHITTKHTALATTKNTKLNILTEINNNKIVQIHNRFNQPIVTASNLVIQSAVINDTKIDSGFTAATFDKSTIDTAFSEVPFVKIDTVTKSQILHNLTDNWILKPEIRKKPKVKYKENLVLAASFASGSQTSSGLKNIASTSLNEEIVKTDVAHTSFFALQNFTDIHYSLPLSFGLKLKDNFSKNLSLETGLVYTYLQTDFSSNQFVTTDAKLGLHYLGIPLKLIVTLWNTRRWEVYISGGGTIEKGLRSVYQQNSMNTFQTIVSSAETNIDGFQLSLNSAAGVNYKINSHFGLFFEPNFSYYFNNNQPVSIRSRQPDVFSLEIGVRYNLNSSKK